MPLHLSSGLISISAIASHGTVWHWLHRLGGPGLVLLGLVDNSAIPVPGSVDVLTIVLAAHNPRWWFYYGFMAVVGAVIGGYLSYRLAEKGGKSAFEHEIGQERAQQVYRKFERQGGYWVFLGAILPPPFPIFAMLTAAGIMQYPKKKFLAALAAGRGVRFFTLAYVAHIYGKQIISLLYRYYRPALYGLIALAVAGAVAGVLYWKWYLPRKRRQSTAGEASGQPRAA